VDAVPFNKTGGMSEDEILADFPDLEREDVRAALAFAADRPRWTPKTGHQSTPENRPPRRMS